MKNLIFILLFLGVRAHAKIVESRVTDDFKEIVRLVEPFSKKSGETLYVFDIDNTVLALPSDFGSEQWFLWQLDLIQNKVRGIPAVAANSDDLLNIQGWIYEMSPMFPVAFEIPLFIRDVQEKNSAVIALTSRILSARGPTIREIQNNYKSFSDAEVLGMSFGQNPYFPYDLSRL